MANIIQIRRDLAATWTTNNPTLASGEMGFETDTGLVKFGDNSTAWTSLLYRPVKYNFVATIAPGVTDDIDSEYNVGSMWIDVTNDKAYISVGSTAGAAVWVETTAGAGGGDPDQNLFETVAGDSGTSAVADTVTDTLTIAGGTGLTTVGDSSLDKITIDLARATNGGILINTNDIQLDINNLLADTPVAADTIAFEDTGGGNDNKCTITVLAGVIDHDILANYVADQHVAHAGVSVTAGAGLTGGGAIDTTKTIDVIGLANGGILVNANDLHLDINSLAVSAVAAGDFFAFEDIGGGLDKKITFANLESTLSHDSLADFLTAEHVDWAGGGAGTIHTDNYIEGGAGTDTTAIHDNVSAEISAITEKVSPVGADKILIEDSATSHSKKYIQITNLPAGGEINDLAVDGISGIADDQVAVGSGAGTAAYKTLPNGIVSYATATNTVSQGAIADLSDGSSVVQTARTLDINGDSGEIVVDLAGPLDLSANRAWSIGIADNPTIPGDYITVPVKVDPDPTGANGRLFYNSTDAVLRYAESTTWRDIVYAGGAFHDGFSDFVADEHVAHAGVSVTAGAGLTGGGAIDTTKTLDVIAATNGGLLVNANDMQLDINSLAADTPVAADTIAFEDVGGGLDNKATITVLSTVIDHDTTTNYATDQHVASGSAETLANKDLTAQTNKRRISRSITIEDPTTADDIGWFRHESAYTITEMVITIVGSATPSVTVDLHHSTDRSAAGAAVITTPTASTAAGNSAETTGHVISSFNDATVPLDSIMWVEIDAKSGTVDEVNITIYATED